MISRIVRGGSMKKLHGRRNSLGIRNNFCVSPVAIGQARYLPSSGIVGGPVEIEQFPKENEEKRSLTWGLSRAIGKLCQSWRRGRTRSLGRLAGGLNANVCWVSSVCWASSVCCKQGATVGNRLARRHRQSNAASKPGRLGSLLFRKQVRHPNFSEHFGLAAVVDFPRADNSQSRPH